MPLQNPQSAYRSFVGVAKQTVYGNLSAAPSAGATSLGISNTVGTTGTLTSAGATYSAIIIDGILTETVACTGNLTGGAIAVAATANAHNINVLVVFQLTASIGPTAFIPLTKLDFHDTYDQLYDKSYRGSQALEYGAQQGMRIGNFALEGDMFADSFGYILGSFFGAYDYTATTGGNPTTYAFSPQNTGNGQPPPYIFYFYNPGGSDCRIFANAVVSDLVVKYDPKALTQWTCAGMAFASGVVATPTPSFSAFTPVAARNGAVTIGGTYTPIMETAEYTFKREEFAAIYTLEGIQDPLAIFSGPVSLAVKWSMVYADDTQLNNYINETQPTFVLTANKGTGTGTQGLKIDAHVANYDMANPVPVGQAYVKLDGSFHAIANTTNASTAGTGYSPALVTLSTGTTTGATLY